MRREFKPSTKLKATPVSDVVAGASRFVPKPKRETLSAMGVAAGTTSSKFDRAGYQRDYMRDYMRKWRAKQKPSG